LYKEKLDRPVGSQPGRIVREREREQTENEIVRGERNKKISGRSLRTMT